MTRCVGCRCCEVACNEQNNNPAQIQWRRVGEMEGGTFPFTQRFHLSMGCNHCLEPSCLEGCPVDAYTKDPLTGLVLHSAEACIGCQYCTWNCPYGVPQYNPERGVVGKCDMCYGRLAEDRAPACVAACPEEAIVIEKVNVAAWRNELEIAANIPGLPPAGQTLSTTRITRPVDLPPDLVKGDVDRVRPEHAHTPLIVMTVLTQLSVGAFLVLWVLSWSSAAQDLRWPALLALGLGQLALAASTAHLGRPIHAYRALKMWRRSWLSREVLLFSLFAGASAGFAGLLSRGWPGTLPLGGLTAVLGLAGITASACIYRVPARPAWNVPQTIFEFHLTALCLGPVLVALWQPTWRHRLALLSVAAGAAQLTVARSKILRLLRSPEFEAQASVRLLQGALRGLMTWRIVLLLAGCAVALTAARPVTLAIAGTFLLAAEFLGRYLFFVSVVPRNMAASFLTRGGRAA